MLRHQIRRRLCPGLPRPPEPPLRCGYSQIRGRRTGGREDHGRGRERTEGRDGYFMAVYIQLYCHMSIVGRQQVQAAPQSTELKINS